MADRILAAELEGSGWSTCTIIGSHGEFCEAPAVTDSGLSICRRHMAKVYAYCQDAIDNLSADQLRAMPQELLSSVDADRVTSTRRKKMSVVYYAAIDGFIKIGTTIYLGQRMKTLGANLLATEPGDRDLEAERHRQFGHLLAKAREYFHPGPDLLVHVAALQRAAV